MAWRIDPNALHDLRDTLLQRGAVSEPPSPRNAGQPNDTAADTSPATEALLRRIAPFVELLYLMMIVDGKCEASERKILQGVTRTFCGAELSTTAVEAMLGAFEANVEAEGVEGRLETIANWISADRLDAEAAFTLTAVMALADDEVEPAEQKLLSLLSELLGISANRARELVGRVSLPLPLNE